MRKPESLSWDGGLGAAGIESPLGGGSVAVSASILYGLTTGSIVVHASGTDRGRRRLRRYRALLTDGGAGGERRHSLRAKHSIAARRATPPRTMAKIVAAGRHIAVLEYCAIGVSLGELVSLAATPDESIAEVGII